MAETVEKTESGWDRDHRLFDEMNNALGELASSSIGFHLGSAIRCQGETLIKVLLAGDILRVGGTRVRDDGYVENLYRLVPRDKYGALK